MGISFIVLGSLERAPTMRQLAAAAEHKFRNFWLLHGLELSGSASAKIQTEVKIPSQHSNNQDGHDQPLNFPNAPIEFSIGGSIHASIRCLGADGDLRNDHYYKGLARTYFGSFFDRIPGEPGLWSIGKPYGGPAWSIFLGVLAGTLAEAANGVICSDDGAYQVDRTDSTGTTFLEQFRISWREPRHLRSETDALVKQARLQLLEVGLGSEVW